MVAATRRRVAHAKRDADVCELAKQAERHAVRGFHRELLRASRQDVAIIAELKQGSPSRGVIRPNLDSASMARELAEAGATALSVLTEEEFFQGSLDNLRRASESTAVFKRSVPCLRKDFILDEFQLLEARANCADAILLIVTALTDSELGALSKKARELELDVLCEVHNERELTRALDAGFDTIGVNNRDLRSFEVDLDTSLRLAPKLPSSVLRVAESGIGNAQDIQRLRAAGYEAFLMGESLMKAEFPGEKLRTMITEVKQVALAR
jgi:indole-3-glycerol phosphate synthase